MFGPKVPQIPGIKRLSLTWEVKVGSFTLWNP